MLLTQAPACTSTRQPRPSSAVRLGLLFALVASVGMPSVASAEDAAEARLKAELKKSEAKCKRVLDNWESEVKDANAAKSLREAERAFKSLRSPPYRLQDWTFYCAKHDTEFSGPNGKKLTKIRDAWNKKTVAAADANRKRVDATLLKVMPKLAAIALKDGDAPAARWMLYEAWNWDGENANPTLEKLVPRIEKAYAEKLTKTYNSDGGYGRRGSKNGCVVSLKKFPKNLKKANAKAFSGFIKGGKRLYVVCALNREAERFADGGNPRLAIRLLQDINKQQTVLERVIVGPTKKLGKTRWIRATFDLPPKGVFEKRLRAVLRVDAIQLYRRPLDNLDTVDEANRSNRFFYQR